MSDTVDRYIGSYAKGLEVQKRELGPFSAFMSPERQSVVHRINMEEIARQTNENIVGLGQLLADCTRHSLERLDWIGETNERMSQSLSRLEEQSHQQLTKLDSAIDRLDKMLFSMQNPAAVRGAERARQAAKNIQHAKQLDEDRAHRLLTEAGEMLVEASASNPLDYKAAFDLGWLHLFFEENYDEAVKWLEKSVDHSIVEAPDFAVYVLRHSAEANRLNDNLDEAHKLLTNALEIGSGDQTQVKVELVEIVLAKDGVDEATKLTDSFVDEDPNLFEAFLSSERLLGNGVYSEWAKLKLNTIVASIEARTQTQLQSEEWSENLVVLDATVSTKILPFYSYGRGVSRKKFKIPDELYQEVRNLVVDQIIEGVRSNAIGSPYSVLTQASHLLDGTSLNSGAEKTELIGFISDIDTRTSKLYYEVLRSKISEEIPKSIWRYLPTKMRSWLKRNSTIEASRVEPV